MAYSTVAEVRALAGLKPFYEREPVKLYPYTGNASNTVFYIPNGYLVDYDGDADVDTSDITVYVSGTAATVSAIDVNANSVTMSAAPAAAATMTAIYAHSPVKDSEISTIIDRMDTIINTKTRSAGTATSYTQYWDGNGEKTWFEFRHYPVTSITSYDIDGSTSLTANTDYWLYPERTAARWIVFASAPANDHQNVQITYSYGAANIILNQLSKYLSAREVVSSYMAQTVEPRTAYAGVGKEAVYTGESKRTSMIRLMDEEIKRLWSILGGFTRGVVV